MFYLNRKLEQTREKFFNAIEKLPLSYDDKCVFNNLVKRMNLLHFYNKFVSDGYEDDAMQEMIIKYLKKAWPCLSIKYDMEYFEKEFLWELVYSVMPPAGS